MSLLAGVSQTPSLAPVSSSSTSYLTAVQILYSTTLEAWPDNCGHCRGPPLRRVHIPGQTQWHTAHQAGKSPAFPGMLAAPTGVQHAFYGNPSSSYAASGFLRQI